MVLEQPQFASLWSAGRTAIFADSRLGASVTALLCPWARGEAFTPDVDRMVLEHPQFASLIESCRGAPNVELRAHRVPLTLLFTDSGLGATVVALLSPWEHPHSLTASGRGVTPNVELPGAPCSIRAAASARGESFTETTNELLSGPSLRGCSRRATDGGAFTETTSRARALAPGRRLGMQRSRESLRHARPDARRTSRRRSCGCRDSRRSCRRRSF